MEFPGTGKIRERRPLLQETGGGGKNGIKKENPVK